MGNNLEKAMLVNMLYEANFGKREHKGKVRNKLIGKIKHKRAEKLSPYIMRLRAWIQANYQSDWEELSDAAFQKIVKFDLYKAFQCVFQDINEVEKNIFKVARATDSWEHTLEGERYDFVVIKKEDAAEEGLAGINIGRLLIIVNASWHLEEENYNYKLAVLRMLNRVPEGNDYFPVFRYTTTIEVVPLDRIERTAHMVPDWPTELVENVLQEGTDIYDHYERLIWNVHSDNACWNYYYD